MPIDPAAPSQRPQRRALPCAFATRRFEDGSAAFQMEPWRLWELVSAPGFPIGSRATARRFVRVRNAMLAQISPLAILGRTMIRGAWRPYRLGRDFDLKIRKNP